VEGRGTLALTPANRPEDDAVPALQSDLARQALTIDQLAIDRGYINSPLVDDVLRRRGKGNLRDMSASARTSSTSGARVPFKIWRHSIARRLKNERCVMIPRSNRSAF
jgi:hypothetical protein